MDPINNLIRSRRSVYPPQYIDKPIPREIIIELLENANHAPTHRLTEPWRFKVFTDAGKEKLGEFLAEKYRSTTATFSQTKFDKVRTNPVKAGAVLAIILHRDPEERVPEWEEIASVACAVQNIWVSCQAYGLGGYWSTPALIDHLGELVPLKPNERCIGLFYLGYCHEGKTIPKQPVSEKVEWVDS